MSCQKSIELDALSPENDALYLFLFHAIKIGQSYPYDLKKVALDILNECGTLPIIVVAVARIFRDCPAKEWHDALTSLRSTKPSRHEIVDEDEMRFYNSFKFSYTYLKDKEAQVIFLLCSVFPKSYKIPVELLSKITIGLGLFGEVDKYNRARSQVPVIKDKLLNSSLLFKAGEECVKMHDVVREVTLEMANEEVQVIMDPKQKLKENMKYSTWIINDFSNCFDGSKLEVLLIWINEIGSLEVPSKFFTGMKSLKVLLLFSKIEFGRTLALSLPKSIQSLENIKTLSLTNWELGDISVLKNLQMLETLELVNCLIIELPNGVSELKTLRHLGLVHCSIERNNPFKVIARCSQLEELHYVLNEDHMLKNEEVSQITFLPGYQRYNINGGDFSDFCSPQLDISIKKSFKPAKLQKIFSKEMIKSLATRAEILELKGDIEFGRDNLIPGIVSIEDGAMKELVKLSLNSWHEIKCLIHAENLQLIFGAIIFSKLVELQLVDVDITEICRGCYPTRFLKQLEKLKLKYCLQLEGTLFKGGLELAELHNKQQGIIDKGKSG
ncbi:probable disease resistance protein At4g27220 [Prosopis cineraria]|uniref:probable disease resistance protein At4g27220 n=1 Tax=Prosopis cineraria TaxID=364024 RepID=UPI00240F131A|nr:probable disease resistance protein At4g27220 [Prosopis cineraria]